MPTTSRCSRSMQISSRSCRPRPPTRKPRIRNLPKSSIARFEPELNAREDKEEARAGNLDHRYNHWTAVRDGLMNAHADVFPHIPVIVKALPNPIDQMKLFELIQIIPSPTKSALKS